MRVIVHILSSELDYVELHLISDLHVGSAQFNQKLFEAYIKRIKQNPNAFMIWLGDLMNNGLKDSKTDIYEEVLMPAAQQDYILTTFDGMQDKTLAIVPGNHEWRSMKAVGTCPSETIASKLGMLHKYSPDIAFVKINFGKTYQNRSKAISYSGLVYHGHKGSGTPGSGLNANVNYSGAFDGIDFFASGHTHQPTGYKTDKLVLDPYNCTVRSKQIAVAIASSFLNYGGYGASGMYKPTAIAPVMLTLHTDNKAVDITL